MLVDNKNIQIVQIYVDAIMSTRNDAVSRVPDFIGQARTDLQQMITTNYRNVRKNASLV